MMLAATAETVMSRPAAPITNVLASPAMPSPARKARLGPAQHARHAAAPIPRRLKPSLLALFMGHLLAGERDGREGTVQGEAGAVFAAGPVEGRAGELRGGLAQLVGEDG